MENLLYHLILPFNQKGIKIAYLVHIDLHPYWALFILWIVPITILISIASENNTYAGTSDTITSSIFFIIIIEVAFHIMSWLDHFILKGIFAIFYTFSYILLVMITIDALRNFNILISDIFSFLIDTIAFIFKSLYHIILLLLQGVWYIVKSIFYSFPKYIFNLLTNSNSSSSSSITSSVNTHSNISHTNYFSPKVNSTKKRETSQSSNKDKYYNKQGEVYKTKHFIDKGGEGSCFITTNNDVIKIFDNDVDLTLKLQKIQKLSSIQNINSNVILPKEELYDENRNFCGYVMNKVQGITLAKFILPSGREDNFTNWNDKNTIELCLSLIDIVIDIHNMGLIIGDFNDKNILIESSNSVFVIDTDSFQIGKLPSEVIKAEFVKNSSKGNPLKSVSDDVYSLCIHIFRILFYGFHPYASKSGGDINDTLQNATFNYHPSDITLSQNVPDDQLIQLWFAYPLEIRSIFYDIFYNKINIRTKRLKRVFFEYYKEI